MEHFYNLMESAPEAATIRSLHAESLAQSREKLFLFLSGWSDGPALYEERFGNPRLSQRHLPFSIGERERDEWLWYMHKALDENKICPEVKVHLKGWFAEIEDFMRNRQEQTVVAFLASPNSRFQPPRAPPGQPRSAQSKYQ